MGEDPQLIDPENGNFQLAPDSPAQGYGCQTFAGKRMQKKFSRNCSMASVVKKRNSIEVGGEIADNTLWNADTVYVTDDVRILNNAELGIVSGCQVRFTGYYQIKVIEGNILAIGAPEDRITFDSINSEMFTIDETTNGAWHGITFDSVADINNDSYFSYCIFQHAKAISDSNFEVRGSVMRFYQTNKVLVENCIFLENLAYYGGVMSFSYGSSPQIINNLMYSNYALTNASVFYISNSYPKIISNTIPYNYDLNSDENYETAPIFCYFSKPVLYNNIIFYNESNYFDPVQVRENKFYYTEFNNVESGISGENNVSYLPNFVNPTQGNFSLLETSECIDIGSISIWENLSNTDLAGNDRIFGNQIDIGAYEFHPDSNGIDDLCISEMKLFNYPNPFNPETKIQYSSVWVSSQAFVKIYNSKGQFVKKIAIDSKNDFVIWDGTSSTHKNVSSGIYFYQIVDSKIKSPLHKMVLLK